MITYLVGLRSLWLLGGLVLARIMQLCGLDWVPLLLGAIAFALWNSLLRAKSRDFSIITLLLIGGLFCGFLAGRLSLNSTHSPWLGQEFTHPVTLRVELTEDARSLRDGALANARLLEAWDQAGNSCSAGGIARLHLVRQPADLYCGEIITLQKFSLPLKSPPQAVNTQPWLQHRGTIVREGFSSWLAGLRAAVLAQFLQAAGRLQGGSGGFLVALLCGDTDGIEDGMKLLFRNAGVTHVLALSGMHLSMVAVLAGFMLLPFRRGWWQFALILAVMCAYAWLAGFRPSIMRALVMTALLQAGKRMGLDPDPMGVLGLSFVLLAVTGWDAVWSVASLLSFGALAGIFACQQCFEPLFKPWLGRQLAPALAAGCGATAGTAWLSFLVFGSLRPAGILATLLVVPLVTLFMGVGAIWLALQTFCPPNVLEVLDNLLGVIYHVLEVTAALFGALPGLEAGELVFLRVLFALASLAIFILIRRLARYWK